MDYVRLTKTDGVKQQEIFIRRKSVFWVQGASEAALPTPDRTDSSGSGTILHFAGGPGHTVTVVESVSEVMRLLEGHE